MENDLSFSLDEDEDEAIVTEDVNLSPIVTSNDDMSFTIDEDDTEEEEEETIDMGSFETSTPVVQTETQEALTPSTSESLPEIATELDSRISSKYSMLEDGLVDKAMARLEDSSASWERYDAMVEVARKEDEVTGGQRALMVPKPQSERFTQQSIEAMENNKKELRDNVQEMLNDPNPIRAEAVDKLLDTGMSLEQINFIVRGADFSPVTGAVLGVTDIPENIREARALWGEGRYGSAASLVGISLAELDLLQ